MCLRQITQHHEPSDEAVRKGWKIVDEPKPGEFHPLFRNTQIAYSTEWQTADSRFVDLYYGYYYSGFHVFTSQEDAEYAMRVWQEGQRIVEVEVRGITYEGYDQVTSVRDVTTLVAREMRIVRALPRSGIVCACGAPQVANEQRCMDCGEEFKQE